MTAPAEGPVPARPFRITEEPPGPGLTVIEASAGTGKTYTLTSLVVRYVAEGVPLSSILAVTFTRMATGELRDRIRQRLVLVHRQLSAGTGGAEDELVQLLASAPSAEVAARTERLADALADFDAATIATTHGFCQMVLHGLGSAGDTAADAVLLEDSADLVAEVVDDLYLRWSLTRHGMPPFAPAVARRAALEAVRNPETAVFAYPPGEPPSPAEILHRLAAAARQEVARRLLQDDALTYDELLGRLARTLRDPVRGPEACGRLAERYRVVLVDEFQDTDPVQWSILQQAFGGEAGTRLVLIGDPKQAIYAFRGADVHAYIEAAQQAGGTYTLVENRRSDQALLDATDALFSPLQFGHAGIPFRSVQAPPGAPGRVLPGAPLRVRVVDDHQEGIQKTLAKGILQKGSLIEWIAADVAADISRLLASGAPVDPADVAVLTRTNHQAVTVRDALRKAGVPCVVAGADSVFRSEAASAWLRLLESIQEPTSRSRLVALALTPFIGMRAVEVAMAPEDAWEDLHDRVHRWAAVLVGRGVAALHRAITVEERIPGRVLAAEGGERVLTDIGHLAHLLHTEASNAQLGASSLRAWLAARIRAVDEEQGEAEERSRRLDSDAAAVQVLTVHRAKGLEFPVVYCPFLWDGGQPEGGGRPVVFHDADAGGVRTLDCGCPDRGGDARRTYDGHAAIAESEQRGEDLRLMYVAVTRARHCVVLWWGRGHRSGSSPLGRLLLCRDPVTGEVERARHMEPDGKLVMEALHAVQQRAPELVAVENAGSAGWPAGSLTVVPDSGPVLERAQFDRTLDLRWRRSSYSSVTAPAHGRRGGDMAGDMAGDMIASEPEEPGVADEPVGPSPVLPVPGDGWSAAVPEADGSVRVISPWTSLPGGAEMGTLVHGVLEKTDFSAVPLRRHIAAALSAVTVRGAPVVEPSDLAVAIEAVLTTPLGPLMGGASLSDIGRPDRLDELGFELPVAGGDRPVGNVSTSAIADLLDRHLPAGAQLSGYAGQLRDPLLATALRGYLVGSLDLVFRRRGRDGTDRWYIADYKTNWLGPTGEALRAGHYSRARMDHEMRRRHYPLQALFYTVALHRYLRWRQPGYRPGSHLGGVLYLFVRGMTGPDAPAEEGTASGVYPWAVPPALVSELSDLLDGPGEE